MPAAALTPVNPTRVLALDGAARGRPVTVYGLAAKLGCAVVSVQDHLTRLQGGGWVTWAATVTPRCQWIPAGELDGGQEL